MIGKKLIDFIGKLFATLVHILINIISEWEIVCYYGGQKERPWKLWWVRKRVMSK